MTEPALKEAPATEVAVFQKPRLPWDDRIEEKFSGIGAPTSYLIPFSGVTSSSSIGTSAGRQCGGITQISSLSRSERTAG